MNSLKLRSPIDAIQIYQCINFAALVGFKQPFLEVIRAESLWRPKSKPTEIISIYHKYRWRSFTAADWYKYCCNCIQF